MIEQAKFTYSSLGVTFEKQRKTIEEQGRKQIDAITNQNERLSALTIKDDHKEDHKDICKEIFEKLIEEKFDEIKELTDKINQNDLAYCFKGNTFRKRFNDFDDGIELFKKMRFGEMKLEETKKQQNKSEEQKSALGNIKLLYKPQEAVIKLFNEQNTKQNKEKDSKH